MLFLFIRVNKFSEITIPDKSKQWKTDMLAKEWSSLQTKRRVLPGYTITVTLLVLHVSYNE